ncbi:MAG: hypothetical protein RR066_06885 [Mucinivorans sp.]
MSKIAILLLFFSLLPARGQGLRIGFWNVENLMDTINCRGTNDGEFTPEGSAHWTAAKYEAKVAQLRHFIALLKPDILGLGEVENREVLEDITRGTDYKIVHYEGPDYRGIEVALIYRDTLTLLSSEPIPASTARRTRELLRAEFGLGSNSLVLYVAHLPSRRGNDPRNEVARGQIGTQIDSLCLTELPKAVVVMGDMNSNPLALNSVYNASLAPYKRGLGSYAYGDVWQMYDQILLGGAVAAGVEAQVFAPDELITTKGRYKGYPRKGHPSDHFPVYVDLVFGGAGGRGR